MLVKTLIKLDNWIHTQYKNIAKSMRKRRYVRGGQIPLTIGYFDFRNDFLRDVLRDSTLCARFKHHYPLPHGYGYRLDERVVEYPWVISRLSNQTNYLLDAGSTLNFDFLLDIPVLRQKSVVIYTLAPEQNPPPHPNVSYIYGDLRNTILRDHLFDEIVCISTLEHIGMDNTLVYTQDQRYKEARFWDYQDVLREFQRLLVPGGRLFLTVPYGKYQNCGWMQQFDRARLDDAIRVFDGKLEDQAFYRYTPEGWILSNVDECAECEYFDFYARSGFDPDYATAARAVACVVLSR
jgi:SAM-dependent methyltransferase